MRADIMKKSSNSAASAILTEQELPDAASVFRHNCNAEAVQLPTAFSLWRTLPSYAFDIDKRAQVEQCLLNICSTIDGWRAAIGGDAAAAVNIALRIQPPWEITPRLDLVMTILVRAAFTNCGASFVPSHSLRQMPLDQKLKSRLATSWLTHNLLLAYPELASSGRLRRRRSSIAAQLFSGVEDAS
jgi:hypothetical protein